MNRLLGMGGYDISIHALREEGDQRHQPCHHAGGISIHALREEGDSPHFFVLVARRVFLSTPSVRRATEPRMGNQQPPAISIHALREEGDSAACRQTTMSIISIHALREEGDFMVSFSWKKYRYFYPRPPRGGRRKFRPFISCLFHFYPRPPRGGRPFELLL